LTKPGFVGASEVNHDISKAFDSVSRGLLVREAKMHQYPLSILVTSLLSYAWPRRQAMELVTSAELCVGRGVAPGSPFVAHDLSLHVLGAIIRFRIQ
jgi:hypothetical protein